MSRVKMDEDDWFNEAIEHPKLPGVYSIWANAVVIYIGTASSLLHRLRGHDKRHIFMAYGATHIRSILIDEGREKMESYLINKHRPALNRYRLPGVHSTFIFYKDMIN